MQSKNCEESRTYGMSVGVRQTFPPAKSSSPLHRLLSKPKPDMDWIGSMGAGLPCSFTCFDITPPPPLLPAKQRRRTLRARNCEAETRLLPPVTEGSRADSALPVVP